MTRAPRSFATCTAAYPVAPPAPRTSTVSEAWTCARSTNACHAVLKLAGPHAWAAAAAVGLSIRAMYITGTFHPPAGINPLLVVSGNLPWTFLFVPVLAGAVLLTAFALLWHRWVRRQPWPRRWI